MRVYPKDKREPNYHLNRKYILSLDELVFENGTGSWSRGYRTYAVARFMAFMYYHVLSYGGGTVSIEKTSG